MELFGVVLDLYTSAMTVVFGPDVDVNLLCVSPAVVTRSIGSKES